MKFWDLLRIANRNLFRNKLRTFLTVAAICVGSFTLTMTNAIGDGMRSYVDSQLKNVEGDAVIFVRRKIDQPEEVRRDDSPREYKEQSDAPATRPARPAPGTQFDPAAQTVSLEQMETALKGVDGIKTITPRYMIGSEYITLDGSKKYDMEIGMISQGVTQKVEAGKTISGNGQIVIPLGLAKTLAPNLDDLIGKNAVIGYRDHDKAMQTISLQIVGVATKGFLTLTNSYVDSQTAATIYAAQHDPAVAGRFFSFSIQLATSDQATIDSVKAKLAEKGFTGESIADQQKVIYQAINIFKLVMGLVAFIAFLAASFGIINTLVIAVLERTKEIGLQKALGMGRGRIFAIFSLESVLIGFWGAMTGTVVGIVMGTIVNQILLRTYGDSFEGYSLFVFTIPSMSLVMLIVCTIAFLAGVLPAIRASRLNPIESLRYE